MKPHTLAALRKMLSKRLTEEDLFEITFHTQGIEDNPAKQALYSLLFDEDKRVSNNAAWVFTHFDLHSNQWLYPRQHELTDEVMRTPDDTKRRLLLTILLRQPFHPADIRTDFLDFCLKHMLLTSEPTAVRVLCMKLAYEQCKFFPDLLTELRAGLEIMEPALLPAALKTARRNLLKKL